MKLFINSVFCACFFLSLVQGRIEAADGGSGQPNKKSSIKKLFSKKKPGQHQVLASIPESPQHANVANGGLDLDNKHNEDDSEKTAKTTKGRVDSMWAVDQHTGTLAQPTTASAGKNDQDTADCDNRFTIQPSLEDYFKRFVSKLKVEEREEYRTIFYLEAISERSRKKSVNDEHKSLCLAQKILRRTLGIASSDLTRLHDEHRQLVHQELEGATAKNEQNIHAATKCLQQEKDALLAEKTALQQHNETLTREKTESDKDKECAQLLAKRSTYALGFATTVALASLGVTGYLLSRGKSAQTTIA